MLPNATAPATRAADLAAADRVFYSGIAMTMALIVFVGFAPTFYLRGFFGAPVSITGAANLSPLTQLHGALFTAWVLLFVVQTTLVAARRVAVHRRLGVAGVVLAAIMVAVGLPTAFAAASRGSAPPGVNPLEFLVVPVFDLLLFTGFVTAAVMRRREKEAHKRLMLLAYISIIPAAVARLPGVWALGPPGLFGLAFALAIIAAAYDYWSRQRVHAVYRWGIPILLVSVPVRLAISATSQWLAFAQWAAR